MTRGINITFELLAKTSNEAASLVLLAALDARQPAIRDAAVGAVLSRRDTPGLRVLLERLHTLSGPSREMVMAQPGCLSAVLRNAVVGNNLQTFVNACDEILRAGDFDMIPALVKAIEDDHHPSPDLAARTLSELADMLYAQLSQPMSAVELHHRQAIRARVVESLEQSVKHFSRHRRRQVVEAFLQLTTRDNATLREILADPRDGGYLVVTDVLAHSRHEGVMRLLLSFLDYPQPPSAALMMIGRRADPGFMILLFKQVAASESNTLLQNIKRIDAVAWVGGDFALIDSLDDESQQAALKLVMHSRLNRNQAFALVTHLFRSGKAGCRREAIAALAAFNGTAANALVLEAVNDRDPEIQAFALPQLRHRSITGSLQRLVDMLDSPHKNVRQAARQSLEEFSIERYLGAYETLDYEVRRTTGQLVKKVDPQTVPRVLAELRSSIRGRRIRALELAVMLDVIVEVEDAVFEILMAGDNFKRTAAIRALSYSPTEAALAAVDEARYDNSNSVRQMGEEIWRERRVKTTAAAAPATSDESNQPEANHVDA